MKKLLIIDPQNDFMEIEGAALPVKGSVEDMARLIEFIGKQGSNIEEIFVTLDSHGSYGIERPSFWVDTDQEKLVEPFTLVTKQDVLGRRIVPSKGEISVALNTLTQLENAGHAGIMVWPTHCVVGTWGHCVYAPLARTLADWEVNFGRKVSYEFKGQSPYSEHFSAFEAQVILANDPRTHLNLDFVRQVIPYGPGSCLYVAGQASSHCVKESVLSLSKFLVKQTQASKVWILKDCMSPVPGFENDQSSFFEFCDDFGMRVVNSSMFKQ